MIAKSRDIRLILDNIRSSHNVGSIFRTADSLGVNKIYCTGTTPGPVDRFGRKRKDIAKVALGAEDSVAWEHSIDVRTLLRELKDDGFEIISIEQDARAIDYKEYSPKRSVAIIFGNEVDGISKGLLEASDAILEMPQRGKKESLNVSVAAGIVLFRLFDR